MRSSRSRLSRITGAGLLAVSGLALAVSPAWIPDAAQAATARTTARASTQAASAQAAGAALAKTAPAGQVSHAATIPVGRLPSSVAVDPRNGTVWVVNSLDNTVSEISEATSTVVATVRVGISPVDVAVDPTSATVWVTCLGPYGRPDADNTVAEISAATRKVIATIKVGQAPFGIGADPRSGTVWVADTGSFAVSEINEADRDVVATIRTGTSSAPDSIAVNPSTGVVWVASLGDTVAEINEASREVVASINVKPASERNALNAIAVDPDTGGPWVASDFYDGSSYFSYASQLNPTDREVSASVLVPKEGWYANTADGIAVDPTTSTVWVAENGANLLTLLSEGSDSVARNLATGAEPVAVAVDARTRTVWVANNYADTVTEYSYARPRITSASQVTISAGKQASIRVHATGFPVPEVTVHGGLPAGMRVRLESGGLFIHGRPTYPTAGRTFRLTVSADNGIGTATGQYAVTEQLVVHVR